MIQDVLPVNQDNERLNALLSLLQDENLKVASLAMEQFLKLGQLAEKTMNRLIRSCAAAFTS
jgi:hypothetical protein